MSKLTMTILIVLLAWSFPALAQQKPTKEPSMPEFPPANLSGDTTPTSAPVLGSTPTPASVINSTGIDGVTQGALLLTETFDQRSSWENYTDDRDINMRVENGVYRAYLPYKAADIYVWTLNAEMHSDVIMEVSAVPTQIGELGAYAVMCRADPSNNGQGYYFIVGGDGTGVIAVNVQGDTVESLTDWTFNDVIKIGAPNQIRAVCVGSYLALYVNGVKITEAYDTTFTSGYAGFAALADAKTDTDVSFDNLSIYAATGDTSVLVAPTPTLPPEPISYTMSSVLQQVSFDSVDDWENYSDSSRGVNMRVENGSYRATSAAVNYYDWTLNDESHSDAVIDVKTTQMSTFLNNGYGIMCRADPENTGDGYYFFISGDGYVMIRRVLNGETTQLVDWTTSSAVNQGAAGNAIRAVCVRDYLGFYVNGLLVAEARDSTFSEGNAGIAVIAYEGGNVDIIYDNLTITKALPN